MTVRAPTTADLLHALNQERRKRGLDLNSSVTADWSDWSGQWTVKHEKRAAVIDSVGVRSVTYTPEGGVPVRTDALALQSSVADVLLHPEFTLLIEIAGQAWMSGHEGELELTFMHQQDPSNRAFTWSHLPDDRTHFLPGTQVRNWTFAPPGPHGPVFLQLHDSTATDTLTVFTGTIESGALGTVLAAAHAVNRQYLNVTLPAILNERTT